MSDEKIGAKPEPHTEPPEHFPGGTDAVDDNDDYGNTPGGPATRDLGPEDNPAVEDALPDEVAEPDDKQQEPADDSDHEDKPHEPSA